MIMQFTHERKAKVTVLLLNIDGKIANVLLL